MFSPTGDCFELLQKKTACFVSCRFASLPYPLWAHFVFLILWVLEPEARIDQGIVKMDLSCIMAAVTQIKNLTQYETDQGRFEANIQG